MELDGIVQPVVDIAAVVARTAALMVDQVISIPRIVVLPKGEVKAWFKPFTLDTRDLRYPAPDETLYLRYLDRNEAESIGLAQGGIFEQRPEDYVVSGLIDFPDVAYEENADLLYDLAGQVVAHLASYLAERDVVRVLQLNQREIAAFVHAQMLAHYEVDEGVEFESRVSQGFVPIMASAHTAETGEILDFRVAPAEKSNMGKYLFGGFQRCLKPTVRFDSDSERKLAVVLERDAQRWFRPAQGQFRIFYRDGTDQREYVPDFVAETARELLLIEPKMANQMKDIVVLAKRDAALAWCRAASDHAIAHDGKPWRYLLIPHDVIADNMTLDFLSRQYGET
jgi:type III restriction enzyme